MKYLSPLFRRIFIFAFSIVVFAAFGTIGFIITERLNFLDALWYSLMTLTTVGFEVPPNFSDEGKIITIFLMLFGVGAVLYGLTSLALEFFSGSLAKEYKQRQIKRKMKHLNQHIIICGFGRNGRQAARKLILHKTPFVVIDKKELEPRDDEFGNKTIFIQGNAVEDEILQKAGIEKAAGLIASLPSDADNLFVVISAKQLNPNIKLVSRASNSNTVGKLKSAGAENVIMPDKIGGEHMASLLVTPDLAEFMDNIVLEGTKNINLLEVHTDAINPEFIGKKIEDLKIFPKTGCKIIGYKNEDGSYTINPDETQIMQKNCCLIILGKPDQIGNLKKIVYN